jgi:hypothetical protein
VAAVGRQGLIRRLTKVQQDNGMKDEGDLNEIDGKVLRYFNVGIKERMDKVNQGMPVSLMALKQNR